MVYCLLFYSYIDQRMGGLLHCDVSLHSVWYSLCQSLLYIIIFHHNDIIQSNDGKLILLIIIIIIIIILGVAFLRWLNLDRIISSKLNPLKVSIARPTSY